MDRRDRLALEDDNAVELAFAVEDNAVELARISDSRFFRDFGSSTLVAWLCNIYFKTLLFKDIDS